MQKTDMVRHRPSGASQPPMSLVRAVDLAEPAYQRVDFSAIATLVDKLIYLDNRTRGSAPGVEVLLPAQSEGWRILVNLGFLAKPRRIDCWHRRCCLRKSRFKVIFMPPIKPGWC